MSISEHARRNPDKPATIMGRSGEVVTYGELDAASKRLAQLFAAAGLRAGDGVALFMENNAHYHAVYWAVIRSGMYLTPINRYLTADEAAYIVNDAGCRAIVCSAGVGEVAAAIVGDIPNCTLRLAAGGDVAGYDRYETAVAAYPAQPLPVEQRGDFMNYSSGTTGRPKGIRRPLSGAAFGEASGLDLLIEKMYGVDADAVYLSPAPLYHSAPLAFTAAVHFHGGTNVVMEKFDPVESLQLIEKYRVTHSQWVPTMFVRMLKLDPAERTPYDLSSHRVAIHAAAPCPVEVKRQMIDWWGPIVYEYYGATELNGMTVIDTPQWLAHPGSVGRPILGTLHICDETGAELPVGTAGTVYFERDAQVFTYHNDPDKTADAQHPTMANWTKLGDVGYLDDEGYLYLTDRETFMIISGGVNIYPQEIENALVLHPKIADVAVFGVPNAEMGEEVKAVVQLAVGVEPSDEVTAEILAFARDHLAQYKVPKSVDYLPELPRLETGKLYKRLLKDRYWGNHSTRIV